MEPILILENVKKVYQKAQRSVEALRGIDLTIDKGALLAIVGPSGSGKTTLLNIVGCLDQPTSGSVRYDGRELGGMTEKELAVYRKENISFIFQSYNLIPVLTVVENVELPMVIERRYTKKEMRDRAMQIISSVGLAEMSDRFPRELSGGQEQRVAIARALVKQPIVVLADEPTANLDSHTAEEIVELMERMNGTRETTFIFSTHDALVQRHAHRVVTIRDGLIQADDAITDERVHV
ncbi:MAG TPA: ABC transporter ATP-binding protein [Spirochaetia bacterium]|nr:ABC transporter ATP-binding protein [Spirochaetia bacterium]